MKRSFGDPDYAQTSMHQLENLRQHGNIVKYNNEFDRLANILQLNNVVKLAFYQRGIAENIKTILSEKLERYNTFEECELEAKRRLSRSATGIANNAIHMANKYS